jgi:hypothetical protein
LPNQRKFEEYSREMVGRLRTSFRSGNLNEHLGLLLLKGIAAVAEIPRPEDVGLDAVATLLRGDEDGNCYAEDSFVVQLKSESVESIQYEDHELKWFVGQSAPVFIGRISLADARISLYQTIFINQAVVALHAKKVRILFGESEIGGFLRGQRWFPWVGTGADTGAIWLGLPVLQWTLNNLADKSGRHGRIKLLNALFHWFNANVNYYLSNILRCSIGPRINQTQSFADQG